MCSGVMHYGFNTYSAFKKKSVHDICLVSLWCEHFSPILNNPKVRCCMSGCSTSSGTGTGALFFSPLGQCYTLQPSLLSLSCTCCSFCVVLRDRIIAEPEQKHLSARHSPHTVWDLRGTRCCACRGSSTELQL